jgi:NifU-like protein involved in Fe-S cluster formation
MMNELYNQRILKLAADIAHIGALDAPQASADAVSRLCGSKVHVELSLAADGTIAAFAHQLEA